MSTSDVHRTVVDPSSALPEAVKVTEWNSDRLLTTVSPDPTITSSDPHIPPDD